ncbi:MAG: HNH endonuclease [Planctomycetes bacterium]|nr:HNH endonuclease [Planctomycetota bacterium]
MLNPSHDLWEQYGHSARQHMATLNLLRMSQIRPLVLAVLSAYTPQEVKKTLRFMVSWAARFLVTGGIGGGTLEQHYSARAKDIQEGKLRTARELGNKMKVIVPSDAKFKTAFAAATVSKAYLARYYLRALEKQAVGEDEPELVPNENEEMITLEHVLPISPGPSWKHFSEEEKDAYVKRMGNLALLKKKINVEAGNDSFTFKKSFYKESQYLLTRELATGPTWAPEAVEERQKKLANLAVKAWPLK